MKRILSSILTSIACFVGALCVGCAVTPGNPNVPTINDTDLTDQVSFATATAFTGMSIAPQTAASVQPTAKVTYEIAAAVNSAAKSGTTVSAVQALVSSYLGQWNSPYEPAAALLLRNVFDQYVTPNAPAAATQPSTISPQVNEVLIDVSQGVMDGSKPYTGAMPVATMGAELRPGTSITVRHFVWKSRN